MAFSLSHIQKKNRKITVQVIFQSTSSLPGLLVPSLSVARHIAHWSWVLDDKDKDGGLLLDFSPITALSTSLNSITLPAKDQSYSALSGGKPSVIGPIPTLAKDRSSSASSESAASSTDVSVSGPNKDKTAISTALDGSSSSSQSEVTAPTASTLPSNLDKDKTSITPYLPGVTSATSKNDELVSVNVIFSTSEDMGRASSSLVTANYDKPNIVASSGSSDLTIPDKDRTASRAIPGSYAKTSSLSLSKSLAFSVPSKDKATPTSSENDDKTSNPSSPASTASDRYESISEPLRTTFPQKSSTLQSLPEKDKSASTSVTINEKPYPSFVTTASPGPEKGRASNTLQGSSAVSVPTQHTVTIPAQDQAYIALEVASPTSAPKQEQTVVSLPFEYQKPSSSPALISSRRETSSRYLPDKYKTSASQQATSSAFTPDEGKTSALAQTTPIASRTDKYRTPSYSSANYEISSSENYVSLNSSLDKDQSKSSYTFSKNQVTIPLSPSKDRPTSSVVPSKDQKTISGIPSNHQQTSSLVPIESSLSKSSKIYDSKEIVISISGNLLYASFVALNSGQTNSRATLVTIDSILTKDQSLATSTATHSLPAKDQTTPSPSTTISGTSKKFSVPVTSSPSILTQGARESIFSKILPSFGISTSPKYERPVTAFKNDETSLFPATVTPLNNAVTTPVFVEASTEIVSVSVTPTNSNIPLITPKSGTLEQIKFSYPDQSLVSLSTSREQFFNTSRVVPVWTPAMLGNAYGGGYITIPSIFVTRFPNSPKSSNGIPPGYGLSSKSEIVQPPNYVPTPVVVKVEGSTTAFPGASTPPFLFTESKDETNRPSDSIISSVALNFEGSATTYPGAGIPTTLLTKLKDESNKLGDAINPSISLEVEGSASSYPGAGTPTALFTESKDESKKPSDSIHPSVSLQVEDSATSYPGAGTPIALFTELKDESDKLGDSINPSVSLKVEGGAKTYPGGSTPTALFSNSGAESNVPSESFTRSIATKVEGRTTVFTGTGTLIGQVIGSKDETNKPSYSLAPPVANKLEGSTTGFRSSPTALFTELKNESHEPNDSATPLDSSILRDQPKDQASRGAQTQAEVPKLSNEEQKEQTMTRGPSASNSISIIYNSASSSAESKDELDKPTGVTRISPNLSEDLLGKTLIPSQPSSVGENGKPERTSDLPSGDIPSFSKVTLLTTTVSKDKTDELTAFSLSPSTGATISRVSLSTLEPGYNESIISAFRPTSVLEFEGLASRYTMSLSWGLIGISAVFFLC